jgi:hypothetical protein
MEHRNNASKYRCTITLVFLTKIPVLIKSGSAKLTGCAKVTNPKLISCRCGTGYEHLIRQLDPDASFLLSGPLFHLCNRYSVW